MIDNTRRPTAMSRLHPNESFAPTQPIADHQERLVRQKRWQRLGTYLPNRIPFVHRLLYGAIVLTWCGWAAIGLLSGHMFFLVSRAGPIHFVGVAALLFSAAVLAGAAAGIITLLDHYDTRDNEASYKSARQWCWGIALALFVVAAVVGGSDLGFLHPAASVGIETADGLARLSSPRWLSDALVPVRPVVSGWLLATTLWCLAGCLILRLLGFGSHGTQPSLAASIVAIYVLMVPAFASFTLSLLCYLTSGEVLSGDAHFEDWQRARLAFLHSMVVMCAGIWMLLIIVTASLLLRALSFLRAPRAQPEAGPSAQ